MAWVPVCSMANKSPIEGLYAEWEDLAELPCRNYGASGGATGDLPRYCQNHPMFFFFPGLFLGTFSADNGRFVAR